MESTAVERDTSQVTFAPLAVTTSGEELELRTVMPVKSARIKSEVWRRSRSYQIHLNLPR